MNRWSHSTLTPRAAAVDADIEDGERIDIGWDRPVSMREVAEVMGSRAGKVIKVWAVPSAVARTAGVVGGRFMPLIKDMAAMFRWFETGACPLLANHSITVPAEPNG